MLTSIKSCINENRNRNLLGSNFANLGKTQHSFWGGHKICLSFNSESGWKVVKLNIFHRFLRQYLGMYKDTRFDHVFKAWGKEKKIDADLKKDNPINKYMKAIWQKRYLIALGSSSPDDAKVFCFAETHGDIKFRKTFAKIIEAHYRPGDVILVEGGKAGKIYQNEISEIEEPKLPPDVSYNPFKNLYHRITAYFSSTEPTQPKKVAKQKTDQWTKYLKGTHNVQGWEPKEFKLPKVVFKATNEKYAQMMQLTNEIESNTPKSDSFTKEDLEPLKQTFAKLNKEFPILAEYFLIEPEKSEKMLKAMNEYLELLESKDEIMNVQIFYVTILRLFIHLEKNNDRANYHHLKDREMIKKIYDSVPDRNKVMCQEIDKMRQMGKNVFVIGGAAHFLTHNAKRTKDLVETKASLLKHPYVIITKRSNYINDKLEALNLGIKEVAQKNKN